MTGYIISILFLSTLIHTLGAQELNETSTVPALQEEELVCPAETSRSLFSRRCQSEDHCNPGELCCKVEGKMRCHKGVPKSSEAAMRDDVQKEPLYCPHDIQKAFFSLKAYKRCKYQDDCWGGEVCCDVDGENRCFQGVTKSELNLAAGLKSVRDKPTAQNLTCPPNATRTFLGHLCIADSDCSGDDVLCCDVEGALRCAKGLNRSSIPESELPIEIPEEEMVCPVKPFRVGPSCSRSSECVHGYLCCLVQKKKRCVPAVSRDDIRNVKRYKPSLGIFERECMEHNFPALTESRLCESDDDCWPQVCCPDIDKKKRCRFGFEILGGNVPLLELLECSPPPNDRSNDKKCEKAKDCFPFLCCQEGEEKFCRSPNIGGAFGTIGKLLPLVKPLPAKKED